MAKKPRRRRGVIKCSDCGAGYHGISPCMTKKKDAGPYFCCTESGFKICGVAHRSLDACRKCKCDKTSIKKMNEGELVTLNLLVSRIGELSPHGLEK